MHARDSTESYSLQARRLNRPHSNWPAADDSNCTLSRSRCPMAQRCNANGFLSVLEIGLRFITRPDIPRAAYRYRIGSLLMLGDLPFAANPGVCGLDGWNHADLLQTLRNVDWLLEMPDITACCPGHGYCVSAQSMREKLRLMETEASNLTDVPLMDAERISGLKIYADELLEETAALLTIFSGRLYTVSYCLSMLEEEDGAASRVLESLDIDQIDRILSDFRRVAEAFNGSPCPNGP